MVSTPILIKDKIGFHARTASLFAKEAAKFKSDIFVEFKDKKVNGKSTLSLMTLGVKNLDQITLTVEGTDENQAHLTLIKLIESNFKQ
ncbi:MAG: HPr family phosphocarrier protein [Flavobacteriaceae bacterium]